MIQRTTLCFACSLFLALPAACSDSTDGGDDDSGSEAGAAGEAGSDGSGGSSVGQGGSDQGGSSGNASGGTDRGGSNTGGSSTGGSSTGGSGGGSGDPELDALCEEMKEFKADKAAELSCTGSGITGEREAWARICGHAIDCIPELEDEYACWQSATNWSCDTSDGHPQTNGTCSSDAFFACLGPSLHERDPFGCVETQAAHTAAAEDVGCTPDDMVEFTCTQLYLRDLCVAQWEALVECLTADEPANLFECDTDGSLARQAGACDTESDAYDACLPD